ncbi:DNA sulfur modification protein DndE [Desulfuromonas sp. CSMB_57]|uniref:DNA sulfur modification protein DndE n=1 Tax=Desulfuromonas sp. CSMB_57 TaxID=2807629 RepID=UPI001CD3F54E|nr:DNA sulfur modification protein DndE [Desulfuromonas sp. CSMB_57]
MKSPVEHIRITEGGKDILSKVKRHTGIEHWNELCRIALFRSLATPSIPPAFNKNGDSNIDIEWKVLGGNLHAEITAIFLLRARKDGVPLQDRHILAAYFRNHLERGITMLQKVKSLQDMAKYEY